MIVDGENRKTSILSKRTQTKITLMSFNRIRAFLELSLSSNRELALRLLSSVAYDLYSFQNQCISHPQPSFDVSLTFPSL